MARTRNILISLLLALALSVSCLVGYRNYLPVQSDVMQGYDYGYLYSGTKSNSVDFTTTAMRSDSIAFFGSSELSTPPSLIPEVPAVVFGNHDFGFNLTCIGEAYDQSLWQGIAAGAYSDKLKNNKIVISVSPSWFTDGGLDNELFKSRFSYSLYQQFCENASISDTSKAYLKQRLAEQGIETSVINSGQPSNVVEIINAQVFGFLDDISLRNDLGEVRSKGFEHAESSAATPPPFKAIYETGVADGQKMSTNNDWGFDDSYYSENIDGRLDILKDTQTQETMTDTPEYDDFGFLLRVCNEAGLEPLVLVSPVNGYFYDHIGTSSDVRNQCYAHIRQICDAYGAQMADFSDKEYEQYFLHDAVHFGWTGWVEVEQAIYTFAKEA